MTRFKITVAYDGTDFVGWQRQASGVSVQGLLEDALRELDGRDVPVGGAGRTDAGVHALGQVAGFSLQRAISSDAVMRALNARLPDSVRVVAAEDAADTFHPRFGARVKRYRYRIWNAAVGSPFERRYAWHIHEPLDVDAMAAAARLAEGRHDFAAFQASGSSTKTTVREVFASRIADCGLRIGLPIEDCGLGIAVTPESAMAESTVRNKSAIRNPHSAIVEYEVSGDGFLRHMVRIMVGTLVEIGRGRRPAEWLPEVIASRDRAAAGQTAPPEGLFLVDVTY